MRGVFVAVEGPNGVGKTTSAAGLTARLRERGIPVLLTTEPSDTPLGKLSRSGESGMVGRALALAIAADRAAHVQSEIEPALAGGTWVISDRYLPSSLVLQRLDGMELEEIWTYNAFAPPPAVTFYLDHDPAIIRARLDERRHRSRLERIGSPEQEVALYGDAFRFLEGRGWRQSRIDCRDRTPAEVVLFMTNVLDQLDP
ncbi:dTMP kinase [Nonomuraea sp. NPDC050328]|uniref:dTMP kinase n=1 Tax=Nonomuraea sp. NPDC050328 TaxID=3364361 RepID=UPI0037933CF2